MKLIRKIFHPVMALIAIQLVWITLVVFWIYWFVGKSREFRALAEKYSPDLIGRSFNWIVMVEGLIMLAVILAGVYILFAYWKRQSGMYAQQRDFISQVTHELKSPLASIQLHLETIRLRQLPQEKLNAFVGTMLADTERLHYLINNLLMTARLEQRRKHADKRQVDLSAMLDEFVLHERSKLPIGGSVTLESEKGIKLLADPEEIGMVLRNLFENAVLYSPETTDITIRLERSGTLAKLSIQDKGRGLEQHQLKQVFKKFYRVQQHDENVRGTGLGLYIIETIVKNHGGTVRVKSEGLGHGCTFTVSLPVQ